MAGVIPGRMTAHIEGSFVVFLIGMRVNRLRSVRKWSLVVQAMPRMLQELGARPELGLLGGEMFFYWRGIGLIQYWRSFDHLEAYAKGREHAHLPAWQAFNRAVGADGTVGIWHETYLVEAGRHEAIYGNMPPFGLAAATVGVPATGSRAAARTRLAPSPGTPRTEPIRAASYAHMGGARDEQEAE